MIMTWGNRYDISKRRGAAKGADVAKDNFEGAEGEGDHGLHSHLIRLADGTVVATEVGGSHLHAYQHYDDNAPGVLPTDGMHTHVLRLPDGTIVETREDGVHRHPPGDNRYEGVHSHIVVADGVMLETQIDGTHWHHTSLADMSKSLPPEVGPVITDQSGWSTRFMDTPPNLPATNSLHFDTEETVAKAREVVASLKATKE